MKLRRTVATVMLVLAIAATLCACDLFGGSSGTTQNQAGSVQYTVNIYCEGYKPEDFVNPKTGALTLPKVEPTKTGYEFDGWYLDSGFTTPLTPGEKASSVINVYAKFSEKKLTVKIVDTTDGGSDSTIGVAYGKKLDIRPQSKSGYVFDGWFTDRNCTVAFDTDTEITENLIIYSKWKYATYSIKYECNGGAFASETNPTTYTIADETELIGASKDNYKFDGWFVASDFSGERYDTVKGLTGDVTLYAKYLCLLAEMDVKKDISEKSGDEYVYYTDCKEKEVNFRDIFEFSDGSKITVKSKDGKTSSNGAVQIKANATKDGTTTTYGYEVTVQAEEGEATNTYNVTIYQYDASVVTVVFYANGEKKQTKNVSRGGTVTEPDVNPDGAEGYEFDYWAHYENKYDFASPITKDIELNAKFKPIRYNIIYKSSAGKNASSNPSEYNIESTFELQDATANDGRYAFCGWYADAKYSDEVTDLEGRTGDVTLYARYELINSTLKIFTSTETATYTMPKFDADKEEDEEVTAAAYSVTREEYPYLLDYLIFCKIENAEVTVTDIDSVTSDHAEFYQNAKKEYEATYQLAVSLGQADGKEKVWLRFKFGEERTKKSTDGTYAQIAFTEFAKKGSRDSEYNDFAVEHVKTTIKVTSGEQLYFALESGYRPIVESGSVAEDVYNEMKTILREIVSDTMTEREKVMAISEWLVKNVAYDNATYAKATSGENVSGYRCFGIEGAIIDKVAVCDGISKAVSALCAMEGIRAVQVDGKHGEVNHAWNKVYIDLDGDGNREWTAVDCTSANTLFATDKGTYVEIMNHSFIFATDAFLTEKNGYEYNEKWDGKYVAEKSFDVYSNTYYDVGDAKNNFDVNDEDDVVRMVKLMKESETESGEPTMVDCRSAKNLFIIRQDGTISYATAFQNALTKAGYSIDDINKRLRISEFKVEDDDKTGICFFMKAEEAKTTE